MELSDFKNKKITVMGIGLHGGGIGVIKFLAAQGANILATDLRNREELKLSLEQLAKIKNIKYVLEGHRLEDFAETDMVIKNPGVPDDNEFIKVARAKNIPVESDIGIFFELCPAPIIGVTGTKGKSTTATLLAHFLGKKYPQVILAGNIRSSVLSKLPEINKDSIVVLELSSWQLADAKNHKISPYVAILTNIFEDHLNRYANYEEYVNDKRLIFKYQKPKDYLFINYNESNLREIAKETKSKVYFYSPNGDELLEHNLPVLSQEPRLGAYFRGQKIYFGANQEEICSLKDIKMMGRHVINNVLGAISVAKLYDVKNSDIKIALHDFPGLEGRLQFIAQKGGVKFYNDTTATTPESTIAALNALADNFKDIKNRLVIIAGGADKSLNFKDLAKNICDKCQGIILLKGTATDKIKKEIDHCLKNNSEINLDIKEIDLMEKAVELAYKKAGKNGLVLLSPGCASFGLFKHEFERGDKFNQAVKELK